MTIISPISLSFPRVKKKDRVIHLNLNTYRNLHRMVENACKKKYTEVMIDKVRGLLLNKPDITYTIYYGSRHKHDKMNVGSIISKYFLDTLVHAGCIPDDNDEFVGAETFISGGVDKLNPRCEITILSL